MNSNQAKNALAKHHAECTGTEAWREVRGQVFEFEEARQAADFADAVESYSIEPENLKEFVGEDEMKLGQRLYLAENLPLQDIPVVLFNEVDTRVIAVAKARCAEANREADGRSLIILPWDTDHVEIKKPDEEPPKRGKIIIPFSI
jgi:hypothetical protein